MSLEDLHLAWSAARSRRILAQVAYHEARNLFLSGVLGVEKPEYERECSLAREAFEQREEEERQLREEYLRGRNRNALPEIS